ncbi:hypothetical protein N7488_011431 [Penicillium malachiteum]|nr:hypothetical protein N7488_011431 [Penicillium malachiteum]
MVQGLTGGPGTYVRLKDLFTGCVPEPNSEPALDEQSVFFTCFQDDDFGAAETAQQMFDFLHNHYFQAAHGQWLREHQSLCGPLVVPESSDWWTLARILYTWRDMFATSVVEMPLTKLLIHRIPKYPGIHPVAANPTLYNQAELDWQRENLHKMEEAEIIVTQSATNQNCSSRYRCVPFAN